MTTRLPTAVVQALGDAVVDRLDAGPGPGYLEIRTASQPATANTAASGTLLATVTLADPAFGATNTSGVATATDPAPVAAVAAGTAGWFRAYDSTGAVVHDGSVSATGGGGELQLASTTLAVGVSVDVTSYTWTQPSGA